MTKSEIFKAAHAKARLIGGVYRVAFGASLKQVQAVAKRARMMARFAAIGGSLWENGTHSRVYFNDAAQLIGLKYSTYRTGNISSATHNGRQVSNSEARRIIDRVGRIYLDLGTNKIHSSGEQTMLDLIAPKLRALLA